MHLAISPISNLNDDCLQSIFEACDGCPWTLCTLTKVCRKWYDISYRPSVWRKLVIDKPNWHRAYTRFLSSKYNIERLQSVRYLTVSKPIESRHAHLRPLPFKYVSHITHLYTSNLCLAEIEYLSHQIVEAQSQLSLLFCKNIETWCDTRRFSSDLILVHPKLQHIQFQFSEDGHSGFASIHTKSVLEEKVSALTEVKGFSITCIRDEELIEQRDILVRMEEVENDREEVYYQHEIDQINGKKKILLDTWHNVEKRLAIKYKYLSKLNDVQKVELGFCYAWTPDIWRDYFKLIMINSPHLTQLSLYGWDQLGKLEKVGSRSSTIQPIRADAEKAIAECFEKIPSLKSLQLTDFSVGPGLLQGGKHISPSLQHLEIIFTRKFLRYCTEPADAWLLIGPLKEFVLAAFSRSSSIKRSAVIRLHPGLVKEVQKNPLFTEEPMLKSIKTSLKDMNVEVYWHTI